MAIFYGGLAQFMAGMWEFRNRNTFGATAFSSFGGFWMGFAILFFFAPVTTAALGAHNVFVGTSWFLFAWTIFTAYMTIAALRTNGAVLAVFALLTLTFLFLWIGAANKSGPGSGLTAVGGYLGVLTAIVAWYTSLAGVANSTWGRVVFPVFPLNRP
jgi:succinate-acetate transporter protein